MECIKTMQSIFPCVAFSEDRKSVKIREDVNTWGRCQYTSYLREFSFLNQFEKVNQWLLQKFWLFFNQFWGTKYLNLWTHGKIGLFVNTKGANTSEHRLYRSSSYTTVNQYHHHQWTLVRLYKNILGKPLCGWSVWSGRLYKGLFRKRVWLDRSAPSGSSRYWETQAAPPRARGRHCQKPLLRMYPRKTLVFFKGKKEIKIPPDVFHILAKLGPPKWHSGAIYPRRV